MTQVRVCVVTVWLSGGESLAFRASVRPVEEERAMEFTDPASLAGFFIDMKPGSSVLLQPLTKDTP